jgi:hypothetical protein
MLLQGGDPLREDIFTARCRLPIDVFKKLAIRIGDLVVIDYREVI